MIEVRNLVKKYGSHLAVDHLNFTIDKGKIYGFLGPNGAGKSTTMNIMTGYLGATEGEVLIHGHDILKEPQKAKRYIGYLPENPPLYMDMTPWEYLRFVSELKKIKKSERDREIERVMKRTGIWEVKDRQIKNLSKGYKQRVGLAQAISGSPEVIILDEPTVGLDPNQIIEIREFIRELGKEHTVILSSHILAEIQEVCNHIMIISKGRLAASDTPENLEKNLAEKTTLEIETRMDSQEVKALLNPILDISEVTCKESEFGITKALIETKEGKDVREEIFRAFARRDCPLLTMYQHKATLEEVFIELTQNEGGRQ